MNAKIMKIVIKYCSRRDICRDTKKQCKPIKCKYFKFVVLPTWLRNIQGREGRDWGDSKEYKDYEAIVDFVY